MRKGNKSFINLVNPNNQTCLLSAKLKLNELYLQDLHESESILNSEENSLRNHRIYLNLEEYV